MKTITVDSFGDDGIKTATHVLEFRPLTRSQLRSYSSHKVMVGTRPSIETIEEYQKSVVDIAKFAVTSVNGETTVPSALLDGLLEADPYLEEELFNKFSLWIERKKEPEAEKKTS